MQSRSSALHRPDLSYHLSFCVLCNTDRHSLIECSLEPADKLAKIDQLKRCQKCLYSFHTTNRCPIKELICSICGLEHIDYVYHKLDSGESLTSAQVPSSSPIPEKVPENSKQLAFPASPSRAFPKTKFGFSSQVEEFLKHSTIQADSDNSRVLNPKLGKASSSQEARNSAKQALRDFLGSLSSVNETNSGTPLGSPYSETKPIIDWSE